MCKSAGFRDFGMRSGVDGHGCPGNRVEGMDPLDQQLQMHFCGLVVCSDQSVGSDGSVGFF